MPVLTISAVDHITGILTCVAHGRATGDGAAVLYTPNGALPTGWAPVTDYWLIRVDADHLKLADSNAHALAGTAIANPADNGSGTIELGIGLPYRAPRTAAAGAQIKSEDDNAVWATLVALWNFLTGQAQAIYNGIVLAANQNLKLQGTGYIQHGNEIDLIPFTPGGDWQVETGSPPAWILAGLAGVQVAVGSSVYYPLKVGTDKKRVQAVVVYGLALVGAATLSLYVSSGMGGATESNNVLTLAGGGTTLSVPNDGLWNPRTLTLQTPLQLAPGEVISLRIVTAASNKMNVTVYGIVRDAP